MNVDPADPKNPYRDRFVLSKGHTAPALYGTLAIKGFFPKEDMKTLRNVNSYLQGHPCMNKIPGVEKKILIFISHNFNPTHKIIE